MNETMTRPLQKKPRRSKRKNLSLRALVRACDTATRRQLCIGYEYSKGMLWSNIEGRYRRTYTRLRIRISRCERKYWYSNGELDHGEISREDFWILLNKYVRGGFREVREKCDVEMSVT
jgi:hypothetical protein